jgi:chromosomal replication initiation ATPase DnaA
MEYQDRMNLINYRKTKKRKRNLEAKLKEVEAKMHLLKTELDNVPGLIVELDTYSLRRWFNVLEEMGFSKEELISEDRRHDLVDARRMMSVILYSKGFTYKSIGKIFNRDYSTVRTMIKGHDDLMKYNKGYKYKYEEFFKKIN